MTDIYLASQSPRRKALLAQIGVNFKALHVDVDESVQLQESPENYVKRLAMEKAQNGYQQLTNNMLPVLAADTCIVFHDEIIGKPVNAADACAILARLSGQAHKVLTAVAVVDGDKIESKVQESKVSFRELSPAEIASYVNTGEPLDKAGAYAVQGLAAVFIESIAGSYSGIMGLPLFETSELLKKFGLNVILEKKL